MTAKVIAAVAAVLAAAGSCGAVLWFAAGAADDAPRRVDQVIGVSSGTHGSQAGETPENTIENVARSNGSIEAINRQEGVTTLTLQNLEVVLRVQSRTPPPPPQGGGTSGAATAARLLMLEKAEPPPEPETADDRAIDVQLRQQDEKGS